MCVCVCVSLSTYVSVCMSVYISTCLSICLNLCVSLCMSQSVSLSLSVCLSLCVCMCAQSLGLEQLSFNAMLVSYRPVNNKSSNCFCHSCLFLFLCQLTCLYCISVPVNQHFWGHPMRLFPVNFNYHAFLYELILAIIVTWDAFYRSSANGSYTRLFREFNF
jgi:hypothetical protein